MSSRFQNYLIWCLIDSQSTLHLPMRSENGNYEDEDDILFRELYGPSVGDEGSKKKDVTPIAPWLANRTKISMTTSSNSSLGMLELGIFASCISSSRTNSRKVPPIQLVLKLTPRSWSGRPKHEAPDLGCCWPRTLSIHDTKFSTEALWVHWSSMTSLRGTLTTSSSTGWLMPECPLLGDQCHVGRWCRGAFHQSCADDAEQDWGWTYRSKHNGLRRSHRR